MNYSTFYAPKEALIRLTKFLMHYQQYQYLGKKIYVIYDQDRYNPSFIALHTCR